MKGYLFVLLFSLGPIFGVFSQSSNLNVVITDEACLQENLDIVVDSQGFIDFEWDFCQGDLFLAPKLTFKDVPESNIPVGTSLIKSNGQWYGFVCSLSGNSIFRLDFGDYLLNPEPQIKNLGNIGGLLSAPQDIKVIEFEGRFYAFINNRGNNKLVRVDLGTDIKATTGQAEVLVSGNGFENGGLDVAFDGQSWLVSLTNLNVLTMVDLGLSLANIPTSDKISNTSLIPGANGIGDIKFVNENELWYGFVVSFNSPGIQRLSFGNSLRNAPTVQTLSTPNISSFNLYGLHVALENGKWVIFSSTNQGSLLRFDLGEDITNNMPAFLSLGNLGALGGNLKMDMAHSNSRWLAFTAGWNTNRFSLIEFPQAECKFDQVYATEKDALVKTVKSGKNFISLYAKNETNNTSKIISQPVLVNASIAPPINSEILNNCVVSTINFKGQNLSAVQNITSWEWDFGDGQSAMGQEVDHQYATPGTYKVSLTVISENGCKNFVKNDLIIYAEPVPNFSIPPTLLCSNGTITFENTTPGDFGGLVTWAWDFGDGATSVEKSPNHIYTTMGTKLVQLTANIPGCSITKSYSIDIVPGPVVSFNAGNPCIGDEIIFENLTTGSAITGYTWDFGNGATSTEINPSLTYGEPGVYPVSLTVNNAAGCSNTFTKNITIYARPAVAFINELACTGSPTLFLDRTTIASANIASWKWYFGSATSTLKDAVHTFTEPGVYTVKLVVTSTFGCADSLSKEIEVIKGPTAAFTVAAGCAGGVTTFSDASTDDGEDITSWFWEINGKQYFEQNPAILFEAAGSYTASLTISGANFCQSTATQTVVINPLPVANFSALNTCVGQITSFKDQSVITGDDIIASWSWKFGNITTSTLQNPEVIFNAEGTVPVTLTVTSSNGCSNTFTKNVRIQAVPRAAFSMQQNFGAPPLQVKFTNTTTGAATYKWLFGDNANSISTVQNPTFVYNEIGTYTVRLLATNALGCTDTVTGIVNVLDPRLDVAIEQINTITTAGNLQIVLKITNKGSLTLRKMELILDLGGQVVLKEQVEKTLTAGESVNYPLGFQISQDNLSDISYLCATIKALDDTYEEETLSNNKMCLDIGGNFTLLDPFPNPASGILHINFIMKERAPVGIAFYDIRGRSVVDDVNTETNVGLNQYAQRLTHFQPGIYLLKLSHNGALYVRRIVVQ